MVREIDKRKELAMCNLKARKAGRSKSAPCDIRSLLKVVECRVQKMLAMNDYLA
jgi:hypothetical protein